MRGRPDREDYFFISVIVAVFCLFWMAYSYQACGPASARCLFDGIKEWQTLLAGLIALFAAYVAFVAARMNAQQAERHETARVERQYVGARALLPMALNLLQTYADQVQTYLRPLAVHFEAEETGDPSVSGECPKIPNEAVKLIAELIKATPSGLNATTHLAELLSALQIQSSRLEGIDTLGPGIRATITRGGMLTAHRDIFEVRWLVDRFYSFGRGLRSDVRIGDAALLSASEAPTFWAMDFPKLAHELKPRKNIVGTMRSRNNDPGWD